MLVPASLRISLASLAVLAAAATASSRELDDAMKQYVIANCSDDAVRLCPSSLTNQNDAVACMKTKRAQLKQTCRVAYDKVVHTLRQ